MGLAALSFPDWFGIFAPKGTPRNIIGKLNTAAVEALADPTVRSRFVELGFEIFPSERQTPEALGALVKADAEKWWPIIKEYEPQQAKPDRKNAHRVRTLEAKSIQPQRAAILDRGPV
jgi:tripartite-type tricarboxylate transporter receptor subunit TctC